MEFAQEKREALYILEGLENGTVNATDAAHHIDSADPALVYFIFTWLRERYKGHPAADAVLGRVVELTTSHPRVEAKVREGKADPLVAWFEDEYSYRDYTAADFVAFIVEKLEG